MESVAQAVDLLRSWATILGPTSWAVVATAAVCLAGGLAVRGLRGRRKISLEGKVIFITGCDSGFGSVSNNTIPARSLAYSQIVA